LMSVEGANGRYVLECWAGEGDEWQSRNV